MDIDQAAKWIDKEIKIQTVIKNIGEPAILVKTWYQVYAENEGKPWTFGFAINSDIVEHFPVHMVNGQRADVVRSWLRNRDPKPEVVKICEQIIR